MFKIKGLTSLTKQLKLRRKCIALKKKVEKKCDKIIRQIDYNIDNYIIRENKKIIKKIKEFYCG